VLIAALSGLIAIGAVLFIDPDAPLAVGLVIAAIAVCSGATMATLLLSLPAGDGRRSRRAVTPALRRGIEVTAVVGLLLLLRVVDGLTLITGGFVVLGFMVAEVILSARPRRASR
jgi:hypothetical protein